MDFRFHTEAAFFGFRPHFLALFCLRADRSGAAGTPVMDLREALPRLSSATIAALSERRFLLRVPRSFVREGQSEQWSDPVAVLERTGERRDFRVNFNGMTATTLAGARALRELERVLDAQAETSRIYLQPGDLLLIDNRKAVHGRTSFRPAYDGADRWLQRIYIHRAPWQAEAHPSERVVFPWRT
jgi:L-asparagine oxygenase